MSGDNLRATRSTTNPDIQHVMLDDKNQVTPQMSDERKTNEYIQRIDAEILKTYKFTQYQSSDEQKDIQKKISNKYRDLLIEEHRKLLKQEDQGNKIVGLETKNTQLESQISQLQEQISSLSAEKSGEEKKVIWKKKIPNYKIKIPNSKNKLGNFQPKAQLPNQDLSPTNF